MSRDPQRLALRTACSSVRHALTALAAAVLLTSASVVHAGAEPDPDRRQHQCDKGRYDAAADYGACQQHVLANYFMNYTTVKESRVLAFANRFQAALAKCHITYSNTFAALHNRKVSDPPTACDGPRFLDNSDGTVTDQLTGLQWEKKTDDGSVHDKDNRYSWSTAPDEGEAPDGTAYTDFLATLNDSSGCFAGRCDWRLPTIYELQTIVPPSVCTTAPCIDQSVFGPTGSGGGPFDYTLLYWSSTSVIDTPSYAWIVSFTPPAEAIFDAAPGPDAVESLPKNARGNARAVRGGW